MLEKIFGKRKSIKRSLIINFIISIIIVLLISVIGFYIFVNKETLETLIQIKLESKEQIQSLLDITRRSLFILVMNTILICAVVMQIISKKMLQPIQKIAQATNKVSKGNFDVRLETTREDEIGELTESFNQMVEELGKVELIQKDFINNVSHEIKTPISSIKGFAKLLEEDLPQEEKNEYIKIITEESDRLLNISTSILKLTKLQNQDKILKKEKINITEQIRKVIALLETKWVKKELIFNISTEEIYYYGDEELTFQIWTNLIENAIKFTNEKGHIDIEVKQNYNDVEITIKDNGVGMNEEEKEKIFKRFYQIDKSHSQEGSGLGLSIVKRIIDLSKGTIQVESKVGVGTQFKINLPVQNNDNNKIIIK